jgi:hypothetical protein
MFSAYTRKERVKERQEEEKMNESISSASASTPFLTWQMSYYDIIIFISVIIIFYLLHKMVNRR